MRVIIFLAIMCVVSECQTIRGFKLMRNVNKSILNGCNRKTYDITNNIDLFKCVNVNRTNDCKHLKDFEEYQKIRIECINEKNCEFGLGIIIAVIPWLIMGLCCY